MKVISYFLCCRLSSFPVDLFAIIAWFRVKMDEFTVNSPPTRSRDGICESARRAMASSWKRSQMKNSRPYALIQLSMMMGLGAEMSLGHFSLHDALSDPVHHVVHGLILDSLHRSLGHWLQLSLPPLL